MKMKVLGSSSDGNCTLVKFDHQEDWIMFDCGIPYIKTKLGDIQPSYCFVTHNHADHVSRVNAIQGNTEVCGMFEEFDNPKCTKYIRDIKNIRFLHDNRVNVVGKYLVVPLTAHHDTDEPMHYWVSDGYEAIFYGCDCGLLQNELDYWFFMSDIIMLECDYDDVAMNTNKIDGHVVGYKYERDLKKRIIHTHCSTRYIKERMSKFIDLGYKIVLGHLSNNYNSKDNTKKKMKGFTVIDRTDCPYEIST